MAKNEVKIFDIMACNVYWDFESSIMPKETHKFLVAFLPTPGEATPDMIETLIAYGPDGYEVKFKNEKYENLVDIVIDGGIGGIEPSTVLDCTNDEIEIIREGKGPIDVL